MDHFNSCKNSKTVSRVNTALYNSQTIDVPECYTMENNGLGSHSEVNENCFSLRYNLRGDKMYCNYTEEENTETQL